MTATIVASRAARRRLYRGRHRLLSGQPVPALPIRPAQSYRPAAGRTLLAARVTFTALISAAVVIFIVSVHRPEMIGAFAAAACWPFGRRRGRHIEPLFDPNDAGPYHLTSYGEIEALRAELTDADNLLRDEQLLVEQLQNALDRSKPAPDATELAWQLRAVWLRADHLDPADVTRWRAVAETAIDVVRGLWPLDSGADLRATGAGPSGRAGTPRPDGTLTGAEVAALDQEAARRLAEAAAAALQTSPEGGESAAEAPAATGDPASGDHLEALARVMASCDESLTGLTWEAMRDNVRDSYRTLARSAAAAGWRPPKGSSRQQVSVIAALLVGHDLLDDGTCRCGWGMDGYAVQDGQFVFHAEHVAERLVQTGALA